ncbi:MAG: calcium-binding protein [Pseudomonadota bacterium]
MATRRARTSRPRHRSRLGRKDLAAMIEEATVDAFTSSEQATGWLTKIGEHLTLPFATTVLGVEMKVVKIDLPRDDTLVAVCTRGRQRHVIALADLPLPEQQPAGAEWIEAYRLWIKERG